jgi:hypothetical protein
MGDLMFGLDDTAVVYTPHATTGAYTVVDKSSLTCRLAFIEQGGSSIGGERESIGQRRRLLWEEDYTMPDNAQVEVDSERWNVLVGTFGQIRNVGGQVAYRRCEVIRAICCSRANVFEVIWKSS